MKKIFIAILIGVTVISAVSCSASDKDYISTSSELSQASDTADPSSSEKDSMIDNLVDVNQLGDKTKTNIIDVLENDSMDLSVNGKLTVTGGITVELNCTLAKSDNCLYFDLGLGDSHIKTIQNADGRYRVNDKDKTAVLENINEETSSFSSKDDKLVKMVLSYISSALGLDDIHFKGTGNEEYNGQQYDFEEYSNSNGAVKVYFDHSVPQYIVSTKDSGQQSVITIHKLSKEPDSKLFIIPSDYQITE